MQNALSKLTEIPRGVSLKKALTRERLVAIQQCIIGLAQGQNLETGMGLKRHPGHGKVRLDLDIAARKYFPVYGPFTPLFSIKDAAADETEYICTVTDGVVIDRETGGWSGSVAPDAVILYKCANRLDSDGVPVEFPVVSGDSAWVKVMVKRTGAVAADYPDQPCSIVIGKGTDVPPVGVSVHWYPPIEPDAYNPASLGADGVYFYKLATFTVGDDGEMKVEYFCGKDNIQHFRELPMIGHVGSGEPIFKQYNPESGRYEYYSIKGIAPIKVEKVDDTLQVSLDPKDGSGTSIPVGSGIYRYMACDGVTVVAEFQWIQGAVVTNIGPPGFVEIPLGDCSDSSSSSSS